MQTIFNPEIRKFWAHSLRTNLQISYVFQSANCKSTFFMVNSKITNPQISMVSNPLIENPQIFTIGQRGWNTSFQKFGPSSAISWQNQQKVVLFMPIFVRRKILFLRIGGSFKSGEKIWSRNRKSVNCPTYGRSSNLTWLVGLQIYGFAICGTYLQTAHLWIKDSTLWWFWICIQSLLLVLLHHSL
jgi:hypothetical protein